MTDLEAIDLRTSRRSYLNTPITGETLGKINDVIEKLNRVSGLSIQFIENGSKAFQGSLISYGMFSGVQSLFALVGNEDDANLREKVGYYGELLVLEATKLGLGTCWVGGTFNRKHFNVTVGEGQTLVCVIPVGYVEEQKGFKEKTIYRLAHRGSKTIEEFYTSDREVPNWFLEGIKAVRKAPSAVNRQPVRFDYREGEVTAYVNNPNQYQKIDLGIAKAHFDLIAGGNFEFGNHAKFIKK